MPRPSAHRQHDAMSKAVRVDVFWMVLAVLVCGALVYAGYRIEPHHVSKKGDRFLATGQWITSDGEANGRRREVWVNVMPDRQLQVDVKRRLHHDVSHWWIEGKSPSPPRRREVYVLRAVTVWGSTQRMTIQVPAKSKIIPTLEEKLPNSEKSV